MKCVLLIICTFLNVYSAFCQPGSLILTHKETGRKVNIWEGRVVKVLYTDGSMLKGDLIIESDSSAKIDHRELKFDSIQTLFYKPRFKSGVVITTIGGALILVGGIATIAFAQNYQESFSYALGIFMSLGTAIEGVCALLIGILPLTIDKKMDMDEYYIIVQKN